MMHLIRLAALAITIIQLPKDSPVRSALGEIVKKLGL